MWPFAVYVLTKSLQKTALMEAPRRAQPSGKSASPSSEKRPADKAKQGFFVCWLCKRKFDAYETWPALELFFGSFRGLNLKLSPILVRRGPQSSIVLDLPDPSLHPTQEKFDSHVLYSRLHQETIRQLAGLA